MSAEHKTSSKLLISTYSYLQDSRSKDQLRNDNSSSLDVRFVVYLQFCCKKMILLLFKQVWREEKIKRIWYCKFSSPLLLQEILFYVYILENRKLFIIHSCTIVFPKIRRRLRLYVQPLLH